VTILYITRGLPASGKTTKAREWVAQSPETRVRINRDDLRAMCHGGFRGTIRSGGTVVPSDWQEQVITRIQEAGVAAALMTDRDVAVDDTNLPQATVDRWQRMAALAGAGFEVWDLRDVPIDKCLTRNLRRIRTPQYVPSDAIRRMHTRYIAAPPPAADGTSEVPQ
jgi:predicted kinase